MANIKPRKVYNLNIRVDEELRILLERAAAGDERTVSDWARVVLRRAATNAVLNKIP